MAIGSKATAKLRQNDSYMCLGSVCNEFFMLILCMGCVPTYRFDHLGEFEPETKCSDSESKVSQNLLLGLTYGVKSCMENA